MPRRPLILPIRSRDATLQGAGVAFWLVLLLAVAMGGARAISGAPTLIDALIPPGLMAAQAKSDASPGTLVLSLQERFPASDYASQVLTPLAAHGYPDWLSARVEHAHMEGQGMAAPAQTLPAIAIVIDDLGDDVPATRRAIALPGAVSLAFLPYPDATPNLAREALRAGHQILVHMPMEPDGTNDPGPNALRADLDAAEIDRRLQWSLARVPGFSGINNHEGSKFTADRAALIPVIEALADRHVFFLDSRTTPDSAVVSLSRVFGVASAGRDIFLDDVQTPGAIEASLAQAEVLAKRDGVAIAIGHPHGTTLDALSRWRHDGFDLVPVSVAIRLKTQKEAMQTAMH
jgi:uncharacterized protein